MKGSFLLIFCIICISISGQIAYVVNSGSQTLSRIDLETDVVDNTFAVLGNSANRVAITEDYLYVVNSGDNNIQKLDRESGSTVSNIYIGSTSNPYDILIHNDFAYITGALSNKIYKIDLLTDTVLEDVNVGGNPAGMAVWETKLYVGNTDYASGYLNCSVSIIDLDDFSVIGEIPTDPNPQYLIEHNNLIHVSCTGNWTDIFGSVQIIDPTTDEIVETLNIGGYPGSLGALGTDIIYIGDSMNSGVYAYNSTTFEIIYDFNSPFLPGASSVYADQSMLATLGGEWGQNFTVNIYDQNEALQNSYNVGLYATDIILTSASGVEAAEDIPVGSSIILMNYPNPFNPTTTISFSSTTSLHQGYARRAEFTEDTELIIYNLKGQMIRQYSILNNQSSIVWDGTDGNGNYVPSGIYLYKLNIDGVAAAVKKCTLLK